jgi:uncharacterized protein (DUF1800 family)
MTTTTVSTMDSSKRRMLGATVLMAGTGLSGSFASSPAKAQGLNPGIPKSLSTSTSASIHLLNRFAFGARPGDIEKLQAIGPGAWLAQQLQPDPAALAPSLRERLGRLSTLNMPLGELLQAFQERVNTNGQGGRPIVREVQDDANTARLLRMLDSPWQLEEVMTDFWYNHFNVFIGKGFDRVMVARYEYDAIRPHVFGRFRDMLLATAMHPAMLFYLDQWNSSARSGINENYAREVMELHTLGVNGGYGQRDVSELARTLSGWTFDRRAQGNDLFRFDERRHDAGSKVVLGQNVQGQGQSQGVWALELLATHSATASHIATKLAQHFVADDPPAALVQHLAATFERTRGDLKQMVIALFEHPGFWEGAGSAQRFKTPLHYVGSAARACEVINPLSPLPLANALQSLGMPLYGCPTPDGFSPLQRAWLGPEAISRRIQFASQLGSGRIAALAPAEGSATTATQQNARRGVAPENIVLAIRPLLQASTHEVAMSAPPDQQAALLLSSPEFLRR